MTEHNAAEGVTTRKGLCSLGSRGVRRKWGLPAAVTVLPFVSLLLSSQVLLTLDDDLDVVRRDQIPVF